MQSRPAGTGIPDKWTLGYERLDSSVRLYGCDINVLCARKSMRDEVVWYVSRRLHLFDYLHCSLKSAFAQNGKSFHSQLEPQIIWWTRFITRSNFLQLALFRPMRRGECYHIQELRQLDNSKYQSGLFWKQIGSRLVARRLIFTSIYCLSRSFVPPHWLQLK